MATLSGAATIGLLIARITASAPLAAIIVVALVTIVALYFVFAAAEPPGGVSITSHHQSGGITAGVVNVDTTTITREVLAENVQAEGAYVSQVRFRLVRAAAGVGFRVEAIEHEGHPIDLDLTAENAAIVMVAGKDERAPNHRLVDMAPPLAASYIATVRATAPIANVELRPRYLS